MTKDIVLLRGINLVKRNRISMPELRRALGDAGFLDVQTYLQSGNVIVTKSGSPAKVAREVNALIREHFGFDVKVLVRSEAELAAVVARNPLARVATNPRRYIVTFLEAEMPPGFGEDLRRVSNQEPFAIIGREVYSWHPEGIGRTPLWERLAARSLGITATSRNWATVTALLEMARQTPR